jgi:hypothetical protein
LPKRVHHLHAAKFRTVLQILGGEQHRAVRFDCRRDNDSVVPGKMVAATNRKGLAEKRK